LASNQQACGYAIPRLGPRDHDVPFHVKSSALLVVSLTMAVMSFGPRPHSASPKKFQFMPEFKRSSC
jgi:hypothetical protein